MTKCCGPSCVLHLQEVALQCSSELHVCASLGSSSDLSWDLDVCVYVSSYLCHVCVS
jgi:hypothetical protein